MTDPRRPGRGRLALLCGGLALLTVAVYARILGHEFVLYDDSVYIFENPHLAGGLTSTNVAWAFTTLYEGIWHPLTWISHLVDVQLWGLSPAGHHAGNVVLHAVNTLLLFGLLYHATGRTARSAFVAALFAVHPLHVESVAWATERKDVLSALFWFLTLWLYQWYAHRPGFRRYALVALAFVLGLLSKPMLVTLPFVLLLWDLWPLGRLEAGEPGALRTLGRLVLEKLPLFALAAATAGVAVVAARAKGAMASLESLTLADRAANAFVSTAAYLVDTAWPAGLAGYYQMPPGRTALEIAGAALLLGALTFLAVRGRRGPLLVGWLWYLGTLAPVSGLVQVSGYSRADRYTYIPLVGIFLGVAWGVPALLEHVSRPRARAAAGKVLAIASVAAVLASSIAAWRQAGTWRDSATFFTHAATVTENNWFAHHWLGYVRLEQGDLPAAEAQFRRSLAIEPDFPLARYHLGVALSRLGRIEEAERELRESLRLDPGSLDARVGLGQALRSLGRLDEAIGEFRTVLASNPDHAGAHADLGVAFLMQRDAARAEPHLRAAARLRPENPAPRCNLAIVHVYRQEFAAAWAEIDACRRLGGTPAEHLEEDLERLAPRSAR